MNTEKDTQVIMPSNKEENKEINNILEQSKEKLKDIQKNEKNDLINNIKENNFSEIKPKEEIKINKAIPLFNEKEKSYDIKEINMDSNKENKTINNNINLIKDDKNTQKDANGKILNILKGKLLNIAANIDKKKENEKNNNNLNIIDKNSNCHTIHESNYSYTDKQLNNKDTMLSY